LSLRTADKMMVKISAVSGYIGTVWVLGVMLLVNSDVFGRLLFNSPVMGTPEIVQNSIAGLTFLVTGWATYLGAHVRSGMIKDRLPQKAGDTIELISYMFGGLLFLGIVIASWKPMMLAWEVQDFQGEGSLRVPTYPLWWIMIFGSLVSSWQCFARVVRLIGRFLGKSPQADGNRGRTEA